MRRGQPRIGVTLSLTAMLWLMFVPAANAYIDAGSTAVLFQAVVAGLAAAGMFLRVFWRRITNFFSRGSDTDETATDVTATDETAAAEAPAAAVTGEHDAEGDAGR